MTREEFHQWARELLAISQPDLAFSKLIDDLRSEAYTNAANVHDPKIRDFVVRIADTAKAFEAAQAELYGYLLANHSPKTS